jgi:HPt (histidine-containing phosphotransfer) domain-containing protein
MSGKYKHLETQAFEEYYGGIDRKMAVHLYNKTADIFLKNIETRLQAVEQGFASDLHNATVVAHQIKGSLLSLGAKTLAESFRQIELNINVKPVPELQEILVQAKPVMKEFLVELEQWKQDLQNSL